jgi:hypothetical protein
MTPFSTPLLRRLRVSPVLSYKGSASFHPTLCISISIYFYDYLCQYSIWPGSDLVLKLIQPDSGCTMLEKVIIFLCTYMTRYGSTDGSEDVVRMRFEGQVNVGKL